MGPSRHLSRVAKKSTLGNFIYMQIRTAIAQKPIFLNIFITIHGNMINIVSTPMFSWSKIVFKTSHLTLDLVKNLKYAN